jgi:hypothetical protein
MSTDTRLSSTQGNEARLYEHPIRQNEATQNLSGSSLILYEMSANREYAWRLKRFIQIVVRKYIERKL